MRTFRRLYKWLTPSWLHEDETDGDRVLWTLGALKDAFLERARQGLDARFPSRGSESALALTGADRGILRGRSETAAHYAQRLIRWRYPRGHRVRGNAFALLEQISEYFGGAVGLYTVDPKGTFNERTIAGFEQTSFAGPSAWDWDGEPPAPRWGRFWVVMHPDASLGIGETPDYGDPNLWGGALGTPGYTVGQTGVTPEDVRALRRLVHGSDSRKWRPFGVRGEWLIVSLDGSHPLPDGTWLHWSKNDGGTQVPARDPAMRFWSLAPEHNNVYAGDPDNFPAAYQAPGGGTYAGDPDNFPASIMLPDGSAYAGDPDNFPTSLRLVDDGDAPA